MADKILTGAGKEKWIPSTVHKILTNEKYIGDALLQKTVTTDFLEKKREINNGLAPQYYVEGRHSIVWRCCTRVEKGPSACDVATIPEEELQGAVMRAINKAVGEKSSVIQ